MIKKLNIILSRVLLISLFFVSFELFAADVKIVDTRHYSNVFGEMRNFRVFLPPGYADNPQKKYPVIYYYHGWSQRYFGSGPDSYAGVDQGDENDGDNIANFVAKNEVIVVKPDGYNRRPVEEYYLRPYNVAPVETYRQFPLYFPELVSYIDANYNTIPDREHRAISGLSMGGFMCFWIGAKYPDMVSAIGNFCGSPEFTAGPQDFPAEYRHMDTYRNFDGINVRLNYGDQDFIRYYHRDLNKVFTRVMDSYEYKVYPAAHSTCGLGEMFDFILKTFENPPAKPALWYHTDVYPEFSVWDFKISSDRDVPGFTVLEKVDQRGFRCTVRKTLPDGEILQFVKLSVTTPPVYEKNAVYTINDIDPSTLKATSYSLKSDASGRLKIHFNGRTHEIGINKAADKSNVTIASLSISNMNFATLNKDVILRVKLLNKGTSRGEGLKASLMAAGKETKVIKAEADFGTIDVNQSAESKNGFSFRVQSDSVEIEKFILTIRDKSNNEWKESFEVPLHKDLPVIKDFEIADGRKVTVVKEGRGFETVLLGSGNGDGIANPGESIVVLVKDSAKLWRASLIINDKYVNPFGIYIRGSDNWGSYDHVGGSAKFSVPVIASDCPEKHVIDCLAEYWLPAYPNHIIIRGKVSIKVAGKDNTPPQMHWVRIPGNNVIQAKLYDGSVITNVKAKLTNKDHQDKNFDAALLDNGTDGDMNAGDNVFSMQIPERRFGLYTVEITATDSSGNSANYKQPDIFVLH